MGTVILTYYSEKFDSKENVVNDGMSSKAFLDIDNNFGISFKNIDAALNYCKINHITPNRIDFNYIDGNNRQMFVKYNISI